MIVIHGTGNVKLTQTPVFFLEDFRTYVDRHTLRVSLVAQMVKKPACNVGDLDLIPGLGRSPGEGNGNPLEYSCLENPMDRGAW